MELTDELKAAIAADAADTASHGSRERLLAAAANAFDQTGQVLEVAKIMGAGRVDGTSSFNWGDDGVVGLGYVLRIGAALVSGASDMLRAENCYAAAALLRQLVEVEYLTWAFAENHPEAADWIASDRKERTERWTPRQIRERSDGRFKNVHYRFHCEAGGHPSPEGLYLLADTNHGAAAALECDLALHAMHIWDHAIAAVRQFDNWIEPVAALPTVAELDSAIREWESNDVLQAHIVALLSEGTELVSDADNGSGGSE